MKIESENKTDNPIHQLREIRDKVSFEIKDMSVQQLKDYLNKKETLYSKTV